MSRLAVSTCLLSPKRFQGLRLNSWTRSSSSTTHKSQLNKSHVLQAHNGPFPPRTHTCGSLSAKITGSRVVLTGWLLPGRKVGKSFYFFPLRDASGTVQLVVPPSLDAKTQELIRAIPVESTVLVEGTVSERPEKQKRPQPGGDIEVSVTSFKLLNPADEELPFLPSDSHNLPSEDLRLRYRYLDLRRSILANNLRKRGEAAHIIRNALHEHGFTEVETPLLIKSTPEGAREFLVPTRLSSSAHSDGNNTPIAKQPLFYALPQSPQQPKQLLIASGAIDRYYQIARCFRDEDGRKDRQPEFTQIDLEMAWVSWGNESYATQQGENWRIGGTEVRGIIETLIRSLWLQLEGVGLPDPFRVMTYSEAMNRYGSDKPDLRFGIQLQDVTQHLDESSRQRITEHDQIVEVLIVRDTDRSFLRAAAEIDSLDGEHIDRIHISNEERVQLKGNAEIFSELKTSADALAESLQLKVGDTAYLAKRSRLPEGGSTTLGRLRLALSAKAQTLGDLTLPKDPHFLWVTEFPLFTRADSDKDFLAQGRWSSSHHPFTAPMAEDVQKMYQGHISEVRGQHYDLVLNGVEIGGGSVRVHDPKMQEHILSQILQLNEQEKGSFNHLLHALRCGAPPHGGIALGFDRLMAILCKAESIRDVIAFPKTGAGTDLLFKSPAPAVPDGVLDQYGIQSRCN